MSVSHPAMHMSIVGNRRLEQSTKSKASKRQRFKPFELLAEDSRNAADLALYCAETVGNLVVLAAMSAAARGKLCADLVEKSAGMVLYLRMVAEGLREGSLRVEELDRMEAGLGGLHSRYYAAFEQRFGTGFGESVQSFLRLVMAAPGPLPLELAADWRSCGRKPAGR